MKVIKQKCCCDFAVFQPPYLITTGPSVNTLLLGNTTNIYLNLRTVSSLNNTGKVIIKIITNGTCKRSVEYNLLSTSYIFNSLLMVSRKRWLSIMSTRKNTVGYFTNTNRKGKLFVLECYSKPTKSNQILKELNMYIFLWKKVLYVWCFYFCCPRLQLLFIWVWKKVYDYVVKMTTTQTAVQSPCVCWKPFSCLPV